MSYHWTSNRRPGQLPVDGQDIHESWCTCSDCAFPGARVPRVDRWAIALSMALFVVAGLAWLVRL